MEVEDLVIEKSVIDKLNCLLGNPEYEIGGILGSRDGYGVTDFVLDIPETKPEHPCVYAPNVGLLNEQIEKWQSEGICFVGLFHTHFAGVRTLSCMDMRYINKIMLAMPEAMVRFSCLRSRFS